MKKIIGCLSILTILFILVFIYRNADKIDINTGTGKYWNVKLESYEDQNIDTLHFSYKGKITDLNNIKKISFAIGTENITYIVNVYDISLQDEFVNEEINQTNRIEFMDFKNLSTNNVNIQLDDYNHDIGLFDSKTLIIINWSYNIDEDLSNKDTIRIN